MTDDVELRAARHFTDRDLDLIEVALESAIRACGNDTALAGEYENALNSTETFRLEVLAS